MNQIKKEIKIEESLAELEKITEQLENGEPDLDQAFKLFEQGAKIYEQIKNKMANYEKKIKILTDKFPESNQPNFSDFDSE